MDKEAKASSNRSYYQRNKETIKKRVKEFNEKVRNNPNLLEKRKKYYREYWRKLREELVRAMGNKCEICGYNQYFEILEFHHKKGRKETKHYWGKEALSYHRIKKIPEDLMLLCANCHREKHLKKR